MIYTTHSL